MSIIIRQMKTNRVRVIVSEVVVEEGGEVVAECLEEAGGQAPQLHASSERSHEAEQKWKKATRLDGLPARLLLTVLCRAAKLWRIFRILVLVRSRSDTLIPARNLRSLQIGRTRPRAHK